MLDTLTATLLTLSAVSLGITTVTYFAVQRVLARRGTNGPTPPVSVLKPLKGIDDGLFENLCSIARQDYPCFEILFAAEDPQDPALAIARQVQHDFPHVPMRFVAGTRRVGLNPKVSNLVALSGVAEHDWLLISDSNVRVAPDYLRATAAELRDPEVGMVCNLITGVGERTVGALLENLHLSSFIAAGLCSAEVLTDTPCVVGKSMLFRHTDLQRLGSWSQVTDVLAEDYLLGTRFDKAGLRVALSPHGVHNVNARRSVRDFFARHLRWCQMRRQVHPGLYFAEPLSNPTPWLLGLALVAPQAASDWLPAGVDLVTVAMTGLVLKGSADAYLTRRLRGRALQLSHVAWIPVKDLIVLGAWVVGAVLRTVCWRGQRFRIGRYTALQPMGGRHAGEHGMLEALDNGR